MMLTMVMTVSFMMVIVIVIVMVVIMLAMMAMMVIVVIVVCLPTAMSHRGDSRTRKQGTNCLTVQSCIYRVLFRLSLWPTALQNILKHKFRNK